jgi:hypothetical protein
MARKNSVTVRDTGYKKLLASLKLPPTSVSVGLHASEGAPPKRSKKKAKKKAARKPAS